ncbi:MAG: helix-turn-helix domain-containing protein [Candidatus Nitrohelix vancouverensis]|uniref:Helix-turn-helix domain-containing protein n=1 Tax=Candidatus Nitrohelix vancouverensis TaxID=2705534 RepID=A0A7T0C0K8_9BACT|nr:MAG: helix-turn-helix domain-containing protein [Candidatus Nitrohelix vancouverensis]
MSTLKIGIANYGEMKARTLAIASGKINPKRNDPKVWFTSMESFAKILSDRNRVLLDLILEKNPGSLAELAELSGRAKSNLSRTLHTMERYGLVRLKKGVSGKIIPRVPYTDIVLDVSIGVKRSPA